MSEPTRMVLVEKMSAADSRLSMRRYVGGKNDISFVYDPDADEDATPLEHVAAVLNFSEEATA